METDRMSFAKFLPTVVFEAHLLEAQLPERMNDCSSKPAFRPPMKYWLAIPTWSLLLLVLLSHRLPAQNIHQIPSPRADGAQTWCIDTTGSVSNEAMTYITQVCEEVHQKINKELCVVVIPTTGGRDVQEFGTDLFNHWGVGKKGFGKMFREDGVLMLVATEDRRAAIVLGNGIGDQRKERTAEQIIDDVVVPLFRDEDANSGLYEGARAIATRLFAVADLDSPVLLPSVSGSPGVRAKVRRHKRRGLWTWWPWILGFTGVGGLVAIVGGRYYLRYRSRNCPTCSDEMILLEEDQDDQFLLDPEMVEENLGSVDYDVWGCLKCEEVLKLRYGRLFTRYSKCPDCWYVTVFKIENTMIPATYSHGGSVRVSEDCKSCSFHRTYTYRTPRRVKSTNSSGGSSSSGSMGGGGSSGGSGFGGGSSSGAGASGGW